MGPLPLSLFVRARSRAAQSSTRDLGQGRREGRGLRRHSSLFVRRFRSGEDPRRRTRDDPNETHGHGVARIARILPFGQSDRSKVVGNRRIEAVGKELLFLRQEDRTHSTSIDSLSGFHDRRERLRRTIDDQRRSFHQGQ